MSNAQLAFDFIFTCLVGVWNVIKNYWFLCSLPAAFILWLVVSLINGSMHR